MKNESNIIKSFDNSDKSLTKNDDVFIGMIYKDKRTDSNSFSFYKIVNFKKSDSYDQVIYEESRDFGLNWSKSKYNTKNIEYYSSKEFNEYYEVLNIPIDEYRKEVEELLSGKRSLTDYKDDDTNSDEETSTSLISPKSKETLNLLLTDLNKKTKLVEVMKDGVKIMMEVKRAELDKMRRGLEEILGDFNKKIKKIQKVISTIELYLGINEEIVEIKDGKLAPENTVIHFWQNLYYMDEEVADPMEDGQGLDYTNIENFDEWLLKYSKYYGKYNYELLIPQQKGILCLRIRRTDKKYTSNYYENALENLNNKMTYILIRNGDKLYRVWGEINIKKLFPNKTELQELKDKWDSLKDSNDLSNRSSDFSSNDRKVSELEDTLFMYKKNYIMLQGLMDRTEVFNPKPNDIQLLTPEAQDKGYVKFVYEDDIKLGDGRLMWNDYVKNINQHIQEGSRIIFYSRNSEREQERFDKRFHIYSHSVNYNLPDLPNDGLYQVKKYTASELKSVKRTMLINSPEEFDLLPDIYKKKYDRNYFYDGWEKRNNPITINALDEKGNYVYDKIPDENYVIYYNPKDTVINYWDSWDSGHNRKNNIHYKIYQDDSFILNYDYITLDDLDYYLYDRIHRRSYLNMIPLLLEVKKQKEKDYNEEILFVKGLVDDMKRKNQKLKDPKKEIWDAIEWFKLKNKWKRNIGNNDVHAWKMIRKKLKLK